MALAQVTDSPSLRGPDSHPVLESIMKLKALRARAFVLQRGRCYYCKARMWQATPAELGLRGRSSRQFKCTAEHLVARRVGGRDTCGNIVAACLYCNRLRHARKMPPTPEVYVTHVRKRVDRGGWHVAFAIFE